MLDLCPVTTRPSMIENGAQSAAFSSATDSLQSVLDEEGNDVVELNSFFFAICKAP